MAIQPITWKNVAAPDLSTSVRAVEGAAQNFSQGMDTLSRLGQSVANAGIATDDRLIKEDTDKVLLGLTNIQTKEEWDVAKQSGLLNPENVLQQAPRADVGLIAQAIDAKDRDIEATTAQGLSNMRTGLLNQQTQTDMVNSASDRLSKQATAATQALIAKGDIQGATKSATTPEAQVLVANESKRLQEEVGNVALVNKDFETAKQTFASNPVKLAEVVKAEKDYNLSQYQNTVTSTGVIGSIPEGLTPEEVTAYTNASLLGLDTYQKTQAIKTQLKDSGLAPEVNEAIAGRLQNNDFEGAKASITSSGLSKTKQQVLLSEVDKSKTAYNEQVYVNKVKLIDATTTSIFKSVANGELTYPEAKEVLESQINSTGLTGGDAIKALSSFNERLASYSNLTPTEQKDYDYQLGLAEQKSVNALNVAQNTYNSIIRDNPIVKPTTLADQQYNELNITDAITKVLGSMFQTEEDDAIVENGSRRIQQLLITKDYQELPSYLVAKAIEEAGTLFNEEVISLDIWLSSTKLQKLVKDRLDDYKQRYEVSLKNQEIQDDALARFQKAQSSIENEKRLIIKNLDTNFLGSPKARKEQARQLEQEQESLNRELRNASLAREGESLGGIPEAERALRFDSSRSYNSILPSAPVNNTQTDPRTGLPLRAPSGLSNIINSLR
jgi:hypothetical protein